MRDRFQETLGLVGGALSASAMLHSFAHWTDAVRVGIRRRALQKELFDVASKLPDEPEARCAYQRLLEEHLRLSSARAEAAASVHRPAE